jgi:Fe-S cluster assembly iron-binding protein IscA
MGGGPLLHITRAAADAIEEITGSAPGSSGVRITALPEASTNGSGPTTVFDFYPAEGPGVGDEVVEDQGVQVFLEQDVVPYLEDKLLDAEITGEEVRFMVEERDGS